MPCNAWSADVSEWMRKYRPPSKGKGRGVTKPPLKKRRKR